MVSKQFFSANTYTCGYSSETVRVIVSTIIGKITRWRSKSILKSYSRLLKMYSGANPDFRFKRLTVEGVILLSLNQKSLRLC